MPDAKQLPVCQCCSCRRLRGTVVPTLSLFSLSRLFLHTCSEYHIQMWASQVGTDMLWSLVATVLYSPRSWEERKNLVDTQGRWVFSCFGRSVVNVGVWSSLLHLPVDQCLIQPWLSLPSVWIMWPWVNCITFLCLSFSIYKIGRWYNTYLKRWFYTPPPMNPHIDYRLFVMMMCLGPSPALSAGAFHRELLYLSPFCMYGNN